MTHQFNYNGQVSYEDFIIVEDLGNVCLHAVDELNYSYFFITKTTLGTTSCLEFGPLDIDDTLLPDESNIHFCRFEYSNNMIIKKITKFLGPKKNMLVKTRKVKVSQVTEITFEEALSYGVNLIDYLKDEENY